MSTTEHRKLAAIMFTDMVGYSALTQRDEALALQLLDEHHALLRGILPNFQGAEIKSTGDGFLVEFPSALAAVQCGVEIQRVLRERNKKSLPERLILIRIGIHLGDVVKRGTDVLGDGVNIAARIEPLAEAGGICVTRAIFEQIDNKVTQPLVPLSRPELKNISANVEVYKLVLDGRAAATKTAASSRKLLFWVILSVIALNLFLFLKYGLGRKDEQTQTTPTADPIVPTTGTNSEDKSIAVLAFANLSDDKGNEYFSDGISEELLNLLAKTPGLKVSARTSAFSFKGRNVPVQEIGKQLGVAYVVEGSVRKSGDKVRITAQLIKTADGFHLWSQTFDRELMDIFAVQDEIAGLIARNLELKIGPASTKGSGTTNSEALRLYLEGREAWNQRTEAGFKRAKGLFGKALELDPKFARAMVGLADADLLQLQWNAAFTFGHRNSPQIDAIEALINRALGIDPDLGEAYASLGMAQTADWDFPLGLSTLRRAVKLSPNYATGQQWLAWCLALDGQMDEALFHIGRAAVLDPLTHRIRDNRAMILLIAGQPGQALPEAEKALELSPNSPQALMVKAAAITDLGRGKEILTVVKEQLRTLAPTNPGYRLGIRILASNGSAAEARGFLDQLSADQKAGWFWGLAFIGEPKKALEYVDLDSMLFADCLDLLYAPQFDAVRGDERFIKILQELELTEANKRAQAWRKLHPPENLK